MSCPNIYLGPDIAHAPPTPYWTNPAIDAGTGMFTVGVNAGITVTARNNGTDNSPPCELELYWSDPTTGFPALPARRISTNVLDGDVPFIIPGAITVPPADGARSHTFYWNPPSAATSVNAGHVCLLARIAMLMPPGGGCVQQSYDAASPTTDPRTAIHNVHVSAMRRMMSRGRKWMAFAFAAHNTLRDMIKTELVVKPLDPKADRERLEALVRMSAVYKALPDRPLKFALPKDVQLIEGRGRVVIDDGQAKHEDLASRMFVGQLGSVNELYVDRMAIARKRSSVVGKPHDVDLIPGERAQTFVAVPAADRDDEMYAVDIEHRAEDGRPIGGLTVVFVPPPNYF